jgi:hypothetical protein
MAGIMNRKAAVELHHSNNAEANAALRPALDQLQAVYAAAPSDQTSRLYLLEALLLNADVNLALRDDAAARGNCEAAQTLLRPIVKDSADFRLLSPWVKTQICLDQPEQGAPARKKLEAMNYRDPTYLKYLSTHQPKKAAFKS